MGLWVRVAGAQQVWCLGFKPSSAFDPSYLAARVTLGKDVEGHDRDALAKILGWRNTSMPDKLPDGERA